MRFHAPRELTGRPTVSVVVPCYNYGHFLPDAVASALDQDGVDVDVLVVDDASTDDSVAVARDLAAREPRVEVMVHETNQGHIATYNDGLARARGDYVVLLSADDVLTRNALTRATALMEAHPDVVLTYGYAVDFEDVPDRSPGDGREWWSSWSGAEWLDRVCSRGRNIIVNPEAVLRTSVMRELVGYDSAHPHAADMDLWMRAATRGRVARVNGPVQAAYRVHGGNMHVTAFAGLLTDLVAVRAVFDQFFGPSGEGRRMSQHARLHARAHRRLAREAVLATGRSDVTPPERSSLVRFARETDPAIARRPVWWLCRPDRPTSPDRRTLVLARLEAWRWAVRWQRWKRLGT